MTIRPALSTQCPPGPSSGQGREAVNDDLTPRHDRVTESWWDERAEAFEAWADSVHPADLEPADTRALQAITRLADLRKEVDEAILEAVREARGKGHTWAEIGAMLGVTRQAAQPKYAPLLIDTPLENDDGEAFASEESPQRPRTVSTAQAHAGTQPDLVAHADWSTDPKKRWCATAVRGDDGRYRVSTPELVGDVDTYFDRLRARVGANATVLAGFDFPIGLPASYAAKVGFTDFRTALSMFGRDEWHNFYKPARSRSEISIGRPFYPYAAGRKGEHRQQYLYGGLGLEDMSHLKRRCERRAQSLFWLIGGNQVGKAAISGWRDLLTPALGSDIPVSIWPFDGLLEDLLARPGTVIAETYPADMCRHLDLPASEPSRSKRCQADRAASASTIMAWTNRNAVRLIDRLEREIEDGFGPGSDGEDPFDAVVGLLGMLDVVFGSLASGEPRDDTTQIEGWMLGYSDA